MEVKFIPIDYDYFDFEGRNYVRVIGRDEKNRRVCLVDTCPVYLWAILEDGIKEKDVEKVKKKVEKIELDVRGRNTKVERVEVCKKKFLGKDVKALKIFATNYKDLHEIADHLDIKGIVKRRGYDLGFVTHYIIERKLRPLQWYEVSAKFLTEDDFGGVCKNLDVGLCIKAEEIREIEKKDFSPKVLAYDIETDDFRIGKGEILMMSLVGDDFRKVITWKKNPGKNVEQDFVEYVDSEEKLLEKFVKYVKELSPDFLVGYFSDGFDLPYLRARADKLKVPLTLGLDNSRPRFHKGILPTGRLSGIVHVDLLKFIQTAYSQYMQSETLSLNEVAKEFLGDTKKEFEIKHSSKLDGDDWARYFEYNLHDSALTYQLFEKFWIDMEGFTKVMQEPIFDVSRSGMSKNVDSYIIHNLEKYDEIPEKRPMHNEIAERRRMGKYEGAFVFEPVPNLYEDIAIFDFTSSYGSTIVTYNLSKSTLLEGGSRKNSYSITVGGEKLYFSKKPGFFPEMLKEIIEKRKQYKKELKKKPDAVKRARSNAYKLLANASYGYQGFFGARYYCREAAAATAAFAKEAIKDSIGKIDKAGFKTIYSDTDSIAFLMNGKSEAQIKIFLGKLNAQLPGIMELEIEDFYKRGIWVTKRTGTIGAKKKYALIDKEGKLKIRGFETVRRDWCQLAREVQNKVIREVLEDGNEKRALDFVKATIKRLKNREVPRERLIIRTQLKKPLSEYKAVSPHVIAARKMKEQELSIGEGNLIEYFIAESEQKKKLVRDRVKLPDEEGKYDIKYYLEHQILPAVENIFQIFDINIKEIMDERKQTTLGDF